MKGPQKNSKTFLGSLWPGVFFRLPLALLFALLLTGCARSRESSRVDTAMGTLVSQTLYVTREQGQTREIQALLENLETQELSWRLAGSQTARINESAGDAQGAPLSPEMERWLRALLQVSEESGGAFDVTVGSLVQLWNLDELAAAGEKAGSDSLPGPEEIREALKECGFEKLRLEQGRIYMPEGMRLDLGAAGKGIACDRIRAYLGGREEITGAVVSVGGSILTYGEKPDHGAFKVAVRHPRREGEYLGILTLEGEWYVSTSGDYERYVEVKGKRWHHILDPHTGYPADSGLCSVTVALGPGGGPEGENGAGTSPAGEGADCRGLLADALSTACFVLGAEEGARLAEAFRAEALFVGTDGSISMTPGMEMLFAAEPESP